MDIQTTRFGTVEVPRDEILLFPDGLLGLQDYRQYVLLGAQEGSPFLWLQSTEDPDLAFVVTDPWCFLEDYSFDLPEEAKKKLAISTIDEVRILVIAVLPEHLEEATLNLKGPLIINLPRRLGQQVVLTEDYSPRFRIFDSLTAAVKG